jgi:putative peptidoglycan lipid II flippase
MNIYRSFATVSGYTAISRVLGFVRDMLTALVLGTGPAADAFFVAFRLPNLFRSLFAEGAFNSAFVPLFTKNLQAEGPDAARRFAEEAMSVLLTALLIVTILAEIFMPLMVALIAPGFQENPDKFELAVLLTRITFPYLLCMSLTALAAGILNALGKFAVAAAAPILLNVILGTAMIIAAGLGLYHRPEAAMMISWAVTISGFAQLAWLTLGARRQGMDLGFLRPRLTPGVRRLFWLAVPGVVTAGITQINLFIGTMIASMSESAVSYLYYADRINQLPLGIVGIAIGVVLLPELTTKLNAGNRDAAMHSHNRSLEFAMLLTIPAAVALMVVPGPIIQVLFQRGAFIARDTGAVSAALAAFAAGLPASVLIRVFLPGFFAREDTRTPMIFAGVSALVNIVGSVVLFFVIGHVGIAVATTLAAWTNALMLGSTLLRRRNLEPDANLKRRLALITLASAIMGAALWAASIPLSKLFTPANSFLVQCAALGALVGGGGVIYLATIQFTGVFSYKSLWRAARG